MMRFYLAARYSRREELRKYGADLEAHGHEVTARWLYEDHDMDNPKWSAHERDHHRRQLAMVDTDDVVRANAVIAFTEPERVPGGTRGGRHCELGMGVLAARFGYHDTVFVVGPKENLFTYHEKVQQFDNWEGCLYHIRWNYTPRPQPPTHPRMPLAGGSYH